jgi:high-affinity Fe2+/Pb2+ permease
MKRMNEKQINLLIGILYTLSALLLLAGAFISLQQNQSGLTWIIGGFMLGTVVSSFDTFRLKKKIRHLEQQLRQCQEGSK